MQLIGAERVKFGKLQKHPKNYEFVINRGTRFTILSEKTMYPVNLERGI
jgi:hypothetical protein